MERSPARITVSRRETQALLVELQRLPSLIERLDKISAEATAAREEIESLVEKADALIDKELLAVNPPKCKLCSSKLILRSGPRGLFWGCKKFPKCRGSMDYGKWRRDALGMLTADEEPEEIVAHVEE